MQHFGLLLLIFGAMLCGALLMLPLILLMNRLLTSQITNLTKSVDQFMTNLTTVQFKIAEEQKSLLTETLTSQPQNLTRAMTQSQQILLQGLLKPLLTNQEALVNRLLSRTAWDTSQADASLVSREAISQPDEYVPMSDDAEAERVAKWAPDELDDAISNLPGWDSTQS